MYRLHHLDYIDIPSQDLATLRRPDEVFFILFFYIVVDYTLQSTRF